MSAALRAAAPVSDAYSRVLETEHARNARQVDRFRLYAAAAVWLLNLAFALYRRDVSGAPGALLALYVAAAGGVLWLRARSPWWQEWSGLAVPLVDVPVIYLLTRSTVNDLHMLGFEIDAAAVATQTALYYLLLLLAGALMLKARLIWLTAAMMIAFQSWFFLQEGRDAEFIAIVNLATLLAAWLSLYARRRRLALMHQAALEETRRERLGRYFSPLVAAELLDASSDLGRGRRCEVTVLFADLRDFTTLAETMDTDAVLAFLNRFQSRMVECIFAAGGTLDKYLGDGLMAYFGAPLPQTDHADRALLCALQMQQAMAALNREHSAAGLVGLCALRLGIGMHSGMVVLGDVGAEQRREFTAVGDTVNVAARIEQYTKVAGADILASEATRTRARVDLSFAEIDEIQLKGRSTPVRLYRVARASGDAPVSPSSPW